MNDNPDSEYDRAYDGWSVTSYTGKTGPAPKASSAPADPSATPAQSPGASSQPPQPRVQGRSGSVTWKVAVAVLALTASALGGYVLGLDPDGEPTEAAPETPAPTDDTEPDSTVMPVEPPKGQDLPGEIHPDGEWVTNPGYLGMLARPHLLLPGPDLPTETGIGTVSVVRGSVPDARIAVEDMAGDLDLDSPVFGDAGHAWVDTGGIHLMVQGGTMPRFSYDNYAAYEDDNNCRYHCGNSADPDCTLSTDTALAHARTLLEDMTDIDGLTFQVTHSSRTHTATVTARDEDGLTGVEITINVTASGVVSASGTLVTEAEVLGDYPLVSAAEAAERFNDPRFLWYGAENIAYSGFGWINEQGLDEPDPVDEDASVVPLPLSSATLLEARLGTGVVDIPPQRYLVPTYFFGADDGREYAMIAIAERGLGITEIPQP